MKPDHFTVIDSLPWLEVTVNFGLLKIERLPAFCVRKLAGMKYPFSTKEKLRYHSPITVMLLCWNFVAETEI